MGRAPSILLGVASLAGCARVTVEADSGACLTWADEERTVEGGLPTEGWECVPGDRGDFEAAYGGGDVPSDGTWTRVTVCTSPSDGDCSLELAAPTVTECVFEEEGPGCQRDAWGGGCFQQRLWSLCGPEPEARGGCCYQAIVADTVYYE